MCPTVSSSRKIITVVFFDEECRNEAKWLLLTTKAPIQIIRRINKEGLLLCHLFNHTTIIDIVQYGMVLYSK